MVSTETLEQFPVFSGLDKHILQKVAQISSIRTFKPSEYIFSEGEAFQDFYLILSGRITIERKLPATWLQTEGIIHTLRGEDVFGWSSLVAPDVLTASARCADTSEVVVINGQDLMGIMENDTKSGYIFMKKLGFVVISRLNETIDKLMHEMAEVQTWESM